MLTWCAGPNVPWYISKTFKSYMLLCNMLHYWHFMYTQIRNIKQLKFQGFWKNISANTCKFHVTTTIKHFRERLISQMRIKNVALGYFVNAVSKVIIQIYYLDWKQHDLLPQVSLPVLPTLKSLTLHRAQSDAAQHQDLVRHISLSAITASKHASYSKQSLCWFMYSLCRFNAGIVFSCEKNKDIPTHIKKLARLQLNQAGGVPRSSNSKRLMGLTTKAESHRTLKHSRESESLWKVQSCNPGKPCWIPNKNI